MASALGDAVGRLHREAAKAYRTIVLPEGRDSRIVQAAARIDQLGLARVVLLGKPLAVHALADDHRLDLANIQVVDPDKSPHFDGIQDHVSRLKFAAEMTSQELDAYLRDPVHHGAGLVDTGVVDGMVVGAATPSGEVARTAIRVVGLAAGSNLVSSSFLMIPPDGESPLTFSDCGVVPDPDADQGVGRILPRSALFALGQGFGDTGVEAAQSRIAERLQELGA